MRGLGQALVSLFNRALPAVLAGADWGSAAANGGYFAGTCAWASLGLLWFAALAIVLRSKVELGVLELILLGALVLFTGWSALSTLWTSSVTLTVFDVHPLLVYLGLVLAVLLVLRRRTVPGLLAGVLAGIVAVCAYALATRLFPERLGTFDRLAGYRLETPVGYWNALGLFAAVGVLLAAGLAVRADRPWSRAAAAAPLPLLMATFFFTFSRGAWVALACGILAACVIDPRRLHLLAGLLALAPWPLLAVVLADRSHALTTATAALSDATRGRTSARALDRRPRGRLRSRCVCPRPGRSASAHPAGGSHGLCGSAGARLGGRRGRGVGALGVAFVTRHARIRLVPCTPEVGSREPRRTSVESLLERPDRRVARRLA